MPCISGESRREKGFKIYSLLAAGYYLGSFFKIMGAAVFSENNFLDACLKFFRFLFKV